MNENASCFEGVRKSGSEPNLQEENRVRSGHDSRRRAVAEMPQTERIKHSLRKINQLTSIREEEGGVLDEDCYGFVRNCCAVLTIAEENEGGGRDLRQRVLK